MVFRTNSYAGTRRMGHAIRSTVSLTALAMMGLAAPAWAQDSGTAAAQNTDVPATTEGASEDIVITGIRASLANSQNIKRNSDTVVDAITASDIGALPDRSVTEALQRVPGIAINRFAGSNDPDHFSAEGSGVTVRGLNFVRSEFNGRDAFAAGVGGQAINFADVPAELLGSVEIYKNSTAENVEGGLAGTVNLNTRKPFDNNGGFHLGFDAEANYGDFEKKWSPTGSLLVSNTWDTGIGRIGVLADVAFSELKYRSDGIQISNFQTRDGQLAFAANSSATQVCRNPLPGTVDTTTLPAGGGGLDTCGAASTAGADGLLDPTTDARYAPIGGQFRTQDFDRKRDGQAFAFQWESTDKKSLLTLQFLRTHTTLDWGERTFESGSDLSEYNTYPYGCLFNNAGPGGTTRAECPTDSTQNYTYDENGLFQKGYVTYPGGAYRGGIPQNGGAYAPNGTDITAFVPAGGIEQSVTRRQVHEENLIKDYGANLKFQPQENLFINLDADYTEARHQQLDVTLAGATFADQELDLTGNLPQVTPHKPRQLAYNFTWAHPDPNAEFAGLTDQQYFSDPRAQFWRNGMDHIEDSTGKEFSFKLDVDKRFDEGFIRDIKFGARYADRDETVRYSTYNWGVLSETWAGNSPVTIAQQGAAQTDYYTFPNFFRGATAGPPGAFYYTGDLIKEYDQFLDFARGIGETWEGTNGAGPQANFTGVANRDGVIPGTPYLPSEIQDVNQSNADAYAQLNFRSDDFAGVRVSGNIGLRYVHTELRSAGAIQITAQNLGVNQTFEARCANGGNPPEGVPPGVIISQPSGVCNVGATPEARQAYYASLQTFAGVQTVQTGTNPDGTPIFGVQPVPGAAGVTQNIAHTSDNRLLPSLNLKFELSPTLIARFAASRVMTLPDLASIRNSFSASLSSDNVITFSLGNPYLKPATASQFDLTLEWYFARVGSLTFDAFYKDISNFFYANTVQRTFTQNGVTLPVQVRIADNYSGHGKIKGFEAAYQQTFDFLPGALSGFGVNASYTYLDSSGLPNSFLQGGSAAHVGNFAGGNLPLEQLSKHTVNAAAFYEKGPISLRAAYNWRSRFLLTAADVIFPYAPIFNDATGTLDGSIFLNLPHGVKVGVQGVNLLNEVTKTLQAYTGDNDRLAPRSYFVNDRRFSFILRGSF